MELKNKTILITGASSGIGKACAETFAKYGANLLLVARRKNILDEIAEKLITKHRIKILTLQIDITKQKDIDEIFSTLEKEWQNIDILINNAGLAIGKDKIQDGSLQDWKTMFNTNVIGLLAITSKVLPQMVQNNSGHIVNIGSISSHEVYTGGTVYCATKHAEKIISKGLKLDLTGTNIKVSSIDPGMVETEFSLVRFNQNTEKAKEVYRNMEPLKACDIAETILFTITRPSHVNISEIVLLPVDQSSTTVINRDRR
ncbi:MAG: SDR family NAD(P)-dependent oxidoreductase [Legionellales bacterium]|nr:SDR family NAD(P)-dependent oxidoreductase [Legionellales bacterium]